MNASADPRSNVRQSSPLELINSQRFPTLTRRFIRDFMRRSRNIADIDGSELPPRSRNGARAVRPTDRELHHFRAVIRKEFAGDRVGSREAAS